MVCSVLQFKLGLSKSHLILKNKVTSTFGIIVCGSNEIVNINYCQLAVFSKSDLPNISLVLNTFANVSLSNHQSTCQITKRHLTERLDDKKTCDTEHACF